MQRRGLLKIFGAVAAHAALPMLAVAETVATPVATQWSAATLTAAMDSMFNSRRGPAMAFFELTQADGVKYAELAGALGEVPDMIRVVYDTFAVGLEGGTPEAAEAQLAKHFYDEFSKYAEGKPLLYWRTKPEFESHEVVRYGETFLTAEEVEDQVWKRIPVTDAVKFPDTHRHLNQFKGTRWRYDESAQLVIPPNVEMDPYSGAYKYVTERVQLHKMRMRLALPQCLRDDIEQIAHPEGAPVTRI